MDSKKIIRETFKQFYNSEYYELKLITTNEENFHSFIIIHKLVGIIVQFNCHDVSIYQASSRENLLNSKYEVTKWLNFMNAVESHKPEFESQEADLTK